MKIFENKRINCEIYQNSIQLLNKFVNKLFIILKIDINEKIFIFIEIKSFVFNRHKEIIY